MRNSRANHGAYHALRRLLRRGPYDEHYGEGGRNWGGCATIGSGKNTEMPREKTNG